MKIKLAIFTLACASIQAHGELAQGWVRDDFIKSEARSCAQGSRQHKSWDMFKDSAIKDYCDCAAEKLADFVSVDDLESFKKTKSMDVLRPLANIAQAHCAKIMLEQMGAPE